MEGVGVCGVQRLDLLATSCISELVGELLRCFLGIGFVLNLAFAISKGRQLFILLLLFDLFIQFVDVVRQYLLDRLNLQAAVGDLGTQDMVDAMALLAELVASPA